MRKHRKSTIHPTDRRLSDQPSPVTRRPTDQLENRRQPRDDFHTTQHSFPDYGSKESIEGAVKMSAIYNKVKSLGNLVNPWKPVDTLDSPPQATGPPLKKQKTGSENGRSVTVANEYSKSHFAFSPEPIEDAGSEYAARTDRTGSHGSLTGLMPQTEGVIEFRNVQRNGEPRSNRRHRSRGGSQSPRPAQRYGRSIEPGRDDIDNSDRDELAEKSPHVSSGPILRRVNSATHIVDAADAAILGSPPKRSIELPRPVKRPLRHVDVEEDELALGTPTPSRNPRPAASSLTNKGGVQTTERNNSHDPVQKARVFVRLESALCLPNYRYIRNESGSWCWLGEVEAGTTEAKRLHLCACTKDGNAVPESEWLRITPKVNKIYHNPNSSYVKISQSQVGNVGGQMVLQFFTSEEAQGFVQWVKENLAPKVFDLESHKLCQTYENFMTEVKKAIGSPSPLANSRVTRTATARNVEESRNVAFKLVDPVAQATAESPTALTRRRLRLVDQMLPSQQVSTTQYDQRSFEATAPLQRSSRSRNDDTVMIDAPLVSSAPVSRWTEDHPEWSNNWRIPLVFHRTTVDKDDIPRLDEGQCLNDNLLGFGLRYLFEEYPERHSELEKRVYVHNTFFYEKLKPAKSKDINYDGVKGWTSKVDLLSYDYIIIPVNEYYHWWVAIICNPGRLDPNHPRRSKDPTSSGRETSNSNSTEGKSDVGIEKSDDVEMIDVDNVQSRDQGQEIRTKEARESADPVETDSNKANRAGKTVVDLVADNTDNDLREKLNGITKPPKKDPSEETKILTLDSMGNSHYPAVAALKRYLLAEFEDKRQTKIKDPPKQIGMKAGNIPEQDNFSDCGIYLLGYIQQFVKDPDRFAQCLMQREKPGWEFDPSELREYWRNTIFEKQKEYQAKHDEEKRRKKEEAARRKAASSTPSDTVVSATESQTSGRNGLSHDSAADNVSSAPHFAKPPVVSRNVPAPAPKPTTALKSPSSYGASPATGTVTNPAAVAVGRGVSRGNMLDSLTPIPRPSTRPQKPADNVVVDLERDESEPEDEVPHLLPDSPLPSEIRRPRSKDHEHSPIQRVSSRTSRQSPEVKFIPKLPDSSPASDRRTSGIAQEISPQTFYSNVPLKPQSPRPQSPLVERKRKPSPARKAKASSPARKTAPSPEPKAQPPESIEIFDPPTPEVQTPATTASKAKTEKRDSHKVASKEDNNHVNNINKTTYGKSDKHTRQKSKIPRRVVDTGGGGSGSGRSRRVEQQQPPPPKTTKDKAETKAAETKAERIPLSPSPARVVSDIPAVQSAEMTPIDLTDEN